MAPFYGWGSTASRLQPLQGGSLLFTMHSILIEFLQERQILFYKQFGFLRDLSKSNAILNLLEITQKALDDGKIARGVFIDLEKAFDTGSHDILLEKLNHYSIRGISNDWFRPYLSDRS